MKTIEEAAKEYSELFEHKEAHRISFLNGVEFTQQWIAVEKELPKLESDGLSKVLICKIELILMNFRHITIPFIKNGSYIQLQ